MNCSIDPVHELHKLVNIATIFEKSDLIQVKKKIVEARKYLHSLYSEIKEKVDYSSDNVKEIYQKNYDINNYMLIILESFLNAYNKDTNYYSATNLFAHSNININKIEVKSITVYSLVKFLNMNYLINSIRIEEHLDFRDLKAIKVKGAQFIHLLQNKNIFLLALDGTFYIFNHNTLQFEVKDSLGKQLKTICLLNDDIIVIFFKDDTISLFKIANNSLNEISSFSLQKVLSIQSLTDNRILLQVELFQYYSKLVVYTACSPHECLKEIIVDSNEQIFFYRSIPEVNQCLIGSRKKLKLFDMSDYSYIKEYVYPLDAHNSPYSYGYANYIGNNKIIASCYKNRLFVFNIKTFQVETTVIFHMKGYRVSIQV